MRSQALEDLFLEELGEIYDAERRIYSGLGLMIKTATNDPLKSAFSNHRKQTDQQIKRLEKSFRILGVKATRGNAAGVSGLIKSAKALAGEDGFDPSVVDAGLISSAQKIEHYEIAAYGCLRTHAAILGYREIEELLADSLKEEEETDQLLTQIANDSVNPAAAAAPYAQARTGVRHAPHGGAENGGLSIGKLALGLTIGTVASVLLAPKPGRETRAQLLGRGCH
jgi:ferritin-like metal-binding protein YciE